MQTHPSNSNEQQEAGIALVNALSIYLHITLENKTLELSGCTVQVDGYSDEPPVMCEAWAHIGKPKGSQPDKVIADAMKLLFCEKRLNKKFRKILLFSDEDAKNFFVGVKWQAAALRENGIELMTLDISNEILAKVKNAQERQRR